MWCIGLIFHPVGSLVFLGEPIGIEYLLSQTGELVVKQRSQDALLVDDNRITSLTEEDKGFGESNKISISVQIKDLSLRVIPQVRPSTEQSSRSEIGRASCRERV